MQFNYGITKTGLTKIWSTRSRLNKAALKTAADKLWAMPLIDAAMGGIVCSLAALGAIAASEGHTWKNMVPLLFTVVLLVIATVFGSRAGIFSTLLATLFFATLLFAPTGNVGVVNDSARSNLGWMLLIGIGFSFLFAPPSSGFRRH